MKITWRQMFDEDGYGPQFSTSVHSEAAFVDFAGLGTVFVPLLSSDVPNRYPVPVLLETLVGFYELSRQQGAAAIRSIPSRREEIDVPKSSWPFLIQFADHDDPQSARELNSSNMFPSSGREVALVRSTLQVTDAPETHAILAKLKWLPTLRTAISGSPSIRPSGPAADRLSQIHFKS